MGGGRDRLRGQFSWVRGEGRFAPRGPTLDSFEMQGGQHSSAELTISVKVPCQECGGRGFVETVTEAGQVVGDTTTDCLFAVEVSSPRACRSLSSDSC